STPSRFPGWAPPMQATRPPSPATRRSTWRRCCFTFYDRDDIGGRLRHRALELSNERALDAYLAHMLLSQVDWSLRHQREPPTPRTTSAWPVWWDSTWRSPSGHDTRTRTTYSACLSQEILNALTPSRTSPLCCFCQAAGRGFFEAGFRGAGVCAVRAGRRVVAGPGVAGPKSWCSGCELAALESEPFPGCPPGPSALAWRASA